MCELLTVTLVPSNMGRTVRFFPDDSERRIHGLDLIQWCAEGCTGNPAVDGSWADDLWRLKVTGNDDTYVGYANQAPVLATEVPLLINKNIMGWDNTATGATLTNQLCAFLPIPLRAVTFPRGNGRPSDLLFNIMNDTGSTPTYSTITLVFKVIK